MWPVVIGILVSFAIVSMMFVLFRRGVFDKRALAGFYERGNGVDVPRVRLEDEDDIYIDGGVSLQERGGGPSRKADTEEEDSDCSVTEMVSRTTADTHTSL